MKNVSFIIHIIIISNMTEKIVRDQRKELSEEKKTTNSKNYDDARALAVPIEELHHYH